MVYDYLARAGDVDWKADDATLQRAQKAIEAGTKLADYRDRKAPQTTNVETVQQKIDTAPPKPPAPVKPKPVTNPQNPKQ